MKYDTIKFEQKYSYFMMNIETLSGAMTRYLLFPPGLCLCIHKSTAPSFNIYFSALARMCIVC